MTIGLLPDDVEPGIHFVRTPWIRGFMAFHRVQRAGTVMLMVLMSSGGLGGSAAAEAGS
jgi:hypothetical protein